ncbi:MAG: hypothetical protein KR126chlam3_00889 [Chlamydiae bacterium]|nr:hypothetical protein [Chlamydiota bacterium]
MLEKLFGNAVIEKILFYLLVNQKGYATELKKKLGIPLYSIQIALARLEQGGIVVRQPHGRTQVYQYNPRYQFLNELQAFLKKAYDSLPQDLRKKFYKTAIERDRAEKVNLYDQMGKNTEKMVASTSFQ